MTRDDGRLVNLSVASPSSLAGMIDLKNKRCKSVGCSKQVSVGCVSSRTCQSFGAAVQVLTYSIVVLI